MPNMKTYIRHEKFRTARISGKHFSDIFIVLNLWLSLEIITQFWSGNVMSEIYPKFFVSNVKTFFKIVSHSMSLIASGCRKEQVKIPTFFLHSGSLWGIFRYHQLRLETKMEFLSPYRIDFRVYHSTILAWKIYTRENRYEKVGKMCN